jgi:hypothetical protein
MMVYQNFDDATGRVARRYLRDKNGSCIFPANQVPVRACLERALDY